MWQIDPCGYATLGFLGLGIPLLIFSIVRYRKLPAPTSDLPPQEKEKKYFARMLIESAIVLIVLGCSTLGMWGCNLERQQQQDMTAQQDER